MHTFLRMSSAERRLRRWRGASLLAACAKRYRLQRAASEDGFLLIEVMVSVLLVGLIAVATFNGFDVVNRITADQRRHSEAALLAAQSQEQLRSNSATALDALETKPHVYSVTVNGTVFTITQEAKAVSASGSATGCSTNEASTENGANVLISSSVTWALLTKSKRPAVRQASVITPPVGSALEVDVANGASPPLPQPGVTAIASYTPEGGVATNQAEGTTGAAGCIVLTGLASTQATVEIAQKLNWITEGGLLQYPTKTVTIVPNLTTQYKVTYAEGGRIEAAFQYKGSTKFGAATVTGDTFVVTNASIPSGYTKFALGGTGFEYEKGGEEKYKFVAGAYSPNAITAGAGSVKYSKGDLFPFQSSGPWTGYAGDCPNNNIGAESESGGAVVTEGGITKLNIPLSYTALTVYNGTQALKGTVSSTAWPVAITNTECSGYEAPLHSFGSTVRHTQKSNAEGHLTSPFQPFGKATLCLEANGRSYSFPFNNANATGSTVPIYLGEVTNAEKLAARVKEESEAKQAREAEETATKNKRLAEEAETVAKREKEEKEKREAKEAVEAAESAAKIATEKKEDEKWKKQKEKFEITETQRKEKEKAFKTNRENEEKAKKLARENEEKVKREAAEKVEKTAREAAEKAEKTAREAKEATEAINNKAKKEAETTEIGKKEVAVATGACP